MKRRAAGVGLSLFIVAAGVTPTLMALNVIETPDSDFGAPRWLVVLLVQPFVLFGLGTLLSALGLPVRVFHVFVYAAGLVFVVTGAMTWTWLLLFGDPGSTAMIGIGPVTVPVPAFVARPLNRIMVGVAAVLMIVIAVLILADAVRRWLGPRSDAKEK
ncbi:MAG: hypothetical protein HYR51_16175 [Candidatus Rokubacteria bacterium]|nr:hypothetical protein [Candidatus Rokubacteria bacterium]